MPEAVVYSSTWEIVSDAYRDFVLTGIFGALVLISFRFGALHSRVMGALVNFKELLERFQDQFLKLTERVEEGFRDNNAKHDAIVREVKRLEVQTADRLARAEEALRSD